MKRLFSHTIFQWVVPCFAFALGMYIGMQIDGQKSMPDFMPLRSPQDGHALIRPLVGFDVSDSQYFPEFLKVKNELAEYIGKAKIQGTLDSTGIYVRTLENGHWFGINENKEFEPGSLLKVPIMIAYFKKAEANPKVLSQRVVYHASVEDKKQGLIEAPSVLVDGKSYTIQELIEYMIIDSDNGAMNFLVNHLELNYLNEVFQDFGIRLPDDKEYQLSAKEVGVFFRRLHNATYLNRENSEKALEILSRVTFSGGIDSGLPEGTIVADKFGERGLRKEGQLIGIQLHDCGIIFNERRYLVCIMTQGKDVDQLKGAIGQLSTIISNRVREL